MNVKDLGPEVKAGDVIEIYHPEDDLPRLLLKIPSTLDDINLQKGVYYNCFGVTVKINKCKYQQVCTSRIIVVPPIQNLEYSLFCILQ